MIVPRCPLCIHFLVKRKNGDELAEHVWHCRHCSGTWFILATTSPDGDA